MEKLLNIDYLKANNKRMYYFGLGFVQIVLNESERIHFYNNNLEAPNDEIHNHRYNFASTILKGVFTEKRYELIPGHKYILSNENCGTGNKVPDIAIEVDVLRYAVADYIKDETYTISFNEFHNVDYNDNVITYLKRSPIITDYAQVLYEKGKEKSCPFAIKYSDDELWEIVADTINN